MNGCRFVVSGTATDTFNFGANFKGAASAPATMPPCERALLSDSLGSSLAPEPAVSGAIRFESGARQPGIGARVARPWRYSII